MQSGQLTFSKSERITSQKLIDELFSGGNSHSQVAFPLRIVYMLRERSVGEEPVVVLISVPKKRLKHAVDRNRVKRQIREAYRHQRESLMEKVPEGKQLVIAFIWLVEGLKSSEVVSSRMTSALKRI